MFEEILRATNATAAFYIKLFRHNMIYNYIIVIQKVVQYIYIYIFLSAHMFMIPPEPLPRTWGNPEDTNQSLSSIMSAARLTNAKSFTQSTGLAVLESEVERFVSKACQLQLVLQSAQEEWGIQKEKARSSRFLVRSCGEAGAKPGRRWAQRSW